MLYYNRIDISQGTDLAKVTKAKNVSFAIIVFLIIDTNFKILYPMVAMI